MDMIKRLLRDCRGATAIEYGLIVSLIAVAALVAMGSINTRLGSMLTNMSEKIPTF
jgi:pilus assembly protein Flp/PilA